MRPKTPKKKDNVQAAYDAVEEAVKAKSFLIVVTHPIAGGQWKTSVIPWSETQMDAVRVIDYLYEKYALAESWLTKRQPATPTAPSSGAVVS